VARAKARVAEHARTADADHSFDAERWIDGARGVIALAEDHPEEAVRHFRRFDENTQCTTCADPWIGRAYARAGKPDSAEVYFRRFVDTPSAELWYDDAHLAYSLRTLGEIYERRGDREQARAMFGRLARLYAHADPQFKPIHDEAVAALARMSDAARDAGGR